ncbi:hypothetical protein AAE478_010384 [Parahypoxylon ruwenzoriense]
MDRLPGRFWRSRKAPTMPSTPAARAGSPPDKSSSENKLDLANHREPPPMLTIPTGQPGRNAVTFQTPKSPFRRGFHFRTPHKRARSPPPASLPIPASPVVVNQDGTIDPDMAAPAEDQLEKGGEVVVAQEKPKIPSFLALSRQDIDARFVELNWQERFRISEFYQNPSPHFRFAPVTSPEARHRDRYANIQPWANNRIKLQVPVGELNYINASPIVLPSLLDPEARPPHRYIAMQGPKAETTGHVWRMVVEQLQSPAVIVMLTRTHEGTMEKCFPYFPAYVNQEPLVVGEMDEFGDAFRAEVRCVSVEAHENGAIQVRKLSVHVDGRKEDMIVWHLLYRKWPDFGIPAMADIQSFFELMRLSREKNASEDNPRVIHCSAGVGRSGTFIALEHLMREIESGDLDRRDDNDEEDLVFKTVNMLREQRKQMVQAESQYLFIYQVLRKLWLDRHGLSEDDVEEPAPKRLVVDNDPFVEEDWEADMAPGE